MDRNVREERDFNIPLSLLDKYYAEYMFFSATEHSPDWITFLVIKSNKNSQT